ncbi:UDP-N-acetylmuramoyl-tripeptide--D-alanyl-D-alanine ligase [Sphingobacterium spiritivorum ATCC 33300]|uniref:UDP-N-acetylmuramoyl-tripeptide--D-alanyl-D-alanine ligase n=2 Tax=Sphingobacterium spiritivorum TaxID=258 RepID=D7VIL6_SPHSI|nr:UDP-N-acetylmuramoyl-tripeptide--D-alanyl-D-alanine ligase [Sphingobacterium spiritivorum]EEI91035.1 UDP-N-acetylmuramoyl-tripeptide--D-alanyl-D-alanine ligase [Sphingobacterium spiritivorum ATCC 33300]EFK59918.1 UDP-N-acetylmuramoyl-tripeptide--D-alanyl-D-alanine ligase [Sphingobacterium spiritivorum ATCC 33861]QQS97711.1 UDP-N-acetylmuramoyl-tripeptide--D-alanyl-D-alanine ligase [Sphingobacterium spiritivorum]QQT37447.1 UDP-N-acetylmuramoyl-tripeptide--D-alanyl-D-alanine ligase [Sphingobac
MTIEALYDLYLQHPYVSTDTRNILPGSLFFALKGANFNGNSFADQALQTGASYVIIDEASYAKDGRYILVDNVLESLQKLANHHRKTLSIPVIGVTGTNGKTTTKELLHATLSQKFKTYATKGNLNNHIGVPLTLLSVDSTIQIAVIEMGANHLKEIAFLCDIAEPTHGLISNVGKAHLEGFGSFEGVKKTKGELYDYLQNHNGTLFLQADNPHLNEMAATRKISEVVTYGFAETNDVIGKLLKADPLLQIEWKEKDKPDSYTVHTQLTGSYNTENFLAAIAVGLYFGVSAEQINTGIERYTPKNNRSQVTKTEHNTIIADYYNANASSMAAALDNIEVIDASRKVIILGDMFEMGDESDAEHEKVVQRAKSIGADRLIFVGKAFKKQAYLEAEFYETSEEAKQALIDRPVINSTILLKASRGMAFEHLMDVL